ncbi:MAG: hypothetical protein DRN03_04165 [Thermoplasmata archaeon]|nr:MAG: hypothetical protein DRN03_04165 [Thermoplasmata archaeon]
MEEYTQVKGVKYYLPPYLLSKLSKLEQVILVAIYQKPFIRRCELSNICRRCGVSYGYSMDKTLQRMCEHNVIKVKRVGRNRYYLLTEEYEPLGKILRDKLVIDSL